MAAYSSFFASGLLANQHPFNYFSSTTPTPSNLDVAPFFANYLAPSPAQPSSPLPIPDDSDIEVDTDNEDREATPTRTFPKSASNNATKTSPRPRLRKRRSSLTVGASPMTAIRSPARVAAGALNLQRHLATSPPRSRSGSVSDLLGIRAAAENLRAATEGTSLVGRMRSGSVGGVILRPRRLVRRFGTIPVPAPAPPPTAPLPAPPSHQVCASSNLQSRAMHSSTGITLSSLNSSRPLFPSNTSNASQPTKGRDRGFSLGTRERGFSLTGGKSAYRTIDEEMKEN